MGYNRFSRRNAASIVGGALGDEARDVTGDLEMRHVADPGEDVDGDDAGHGMGLP